MAVAYKSYLGHISETISYSKSCPGHISETISFNKLYEVIDCGT